MSSKIPFKTSLSAFGKLLDESRAPLYALDADRRVIYCNAACAELLSVPASELIGRQCNYHAPGAGDSPEQLVALLCPPPEAFAGQRQRATLLFPKVGESKESAARSVEYTRELTVEFIPCADAEGDLLGVLALIGDPPSIAQSASEWTESSAAQAAHEWLTRFRLDRRDAPLPEALVGSSPAIAQARAQVRLAQGAAASVLIVGPTGSGRRTIARWIHSGATSSSSTWISLPCADLTEALLRSTLERCADLSRSAGPAIALYLADVDQLPLDLQAPLHAGLDELKSNVRLLSAATRDPAELTAENLFRHDLACRLGTLTVRLPGLARRPHDLPLVAQAFVEQQNARGAKQLTGFDAEALDQLRLYSWPRNIAELRQTVLEAHHQAEGPRISTADLPELFRSLLGARARPPVEEERINLDAFLAEIELELIERALAHAKGNKTKAAELLGLNRPRFYRRLVQLGIVVEFEPSDETPDEG